MATAEPQQGTERADGARGPGGRAAAVAAALPLVVVAAIGPLLALQHGGYYVAQWAPAALVVLAVLLSLVVFDPPRQARLGRLGALGLGALVAYAAWTAASIGWAADHSVAWHEAGRTAMFAALVVAASLLVRMRPSPVGAALATSLVLPAAATVVGLVRLAGDAGERFYNGRLLGFTGYYNAEATFLLLTCWTGVWFAADRSRHPLLRALAVAATAMLAATAVLGQSRGSLVALVAGLVVLLVLSPWRWRSLVPIAIVAGLVAASLHDLNAVYQSLDADTGHVARGAVSDAVRRIWLVTGAALVLGAAWAFADRQLAPVLERDPVRRRLVVANRAAVAVAVLAVAVLGVVAVRTHDVVGDARDAWSRFQDPKVEERGGGPSRLTSISNNGRLELWSTALRVARLDPVKGVGAGNFEAYNYQLRRGHGGYVRQPHDLALEALAERGVVGASLLGTFVLTVLACAWRATRRRFAVTSAPVAAVLAATFVQWLVHAQLEWFWQLPAVEWLPLLGAGFLLAHPWAPVAAVAGEGEREEARAEGQRPRPRVRLVVRVAAGALLVGALLAVAAPYLADRYLERSRALLATDDPEAARVELRRAERLDPWSPDAAIQRLAIADATGDRRAAERAIRDIVARSPEHWSSYMVVSAHYAALGDEAAAQRWRRKARDRNPLGYDFDADRAREAQAAAAADAPKTRDSDAAPVQDQHAG